MARFRLDYLLYLFLVAICITLAISSPSINYDAPTTTDKFEILDYNIDYLSNIALRLDRMLEIIYFGFLVALVFLGFYCGHMQRKVERLEQKMDEWIKVMKASGGGQMHPAYGNISMGREVDNFRIEALVKEIKELRELNDKNAAKEVSLQRLDQREFTLDVLAAQLEAQKREAEIMLARAVALSKDEKEEMAPPAYRHEDRASTEKDPKAGDV